MLWGMCCLFPGKHSHIVFVGNDNYNTLHASAGISAVVSIRVLRDLLMCSV